MMDSMVRPLADWMARRSARRQRDSQLWDPGLWGGTISLDGHLEIDGVDTVNALSAHGSPVMLVSAARLAEDANRFLAAARESFDEALVTFSYKTNNIGGVLRLLHDQGIGAEVISPYELWLAEQLGVPGDQIIVNGVNKTSDFIEHAVRLGVLSINVDTPDELDMVRDAAHRLNLKANVGLRLRVDPRTHFGLDIDSGEALATAARIVEENERLSFSGLQFHALADNSDVGRHIAYMRTALRVAVKLKFELGLATPMLDLGGGMATSTVAVASRWQYARQRALGVPADPPQPDRRRPISAYLRELAEALRDFCRAADLDVPRVALEPGRCIVSASHILTTRVHAIKSNPSGAAFALTDAGKILTSQPCDYEYHQIFVANRMHETPSRRYTLMGRLCTTADWLAPNRLLPRLAAGDTLAIMDAGAYFMSYSTNFAFPRPAVVLLDNSVMTRLRPRESYEHLSAMDREQLKLQ